MAVWDAEGSVRQSAAPELVVRARLQCRVLTGYSMVLTLYYSQGSHIVLLTGYSHGSAHRVLAPVLVGRAGRTVVSRRLVAVVPCSDAACGTTGCGMSLGISSKGHFAVLTWAVHAAPEYMRVSFSPREQPRKRRAGHRNAVWRAHECLCLRVALWRTTWVLTAYSRGTPGVVHLSGRFPAASGCGRA